jgi:uncharacterized linocin/CFP29 family protein
MHPDLIEIGWTEEQWNRIVTTVTEEAQKARVATQLLPVTGPVDPTAVSIPAFELKTEAKKLGTVANRLGVDSSPKLHLTKLSVLVALHFREAADPDLKAALVMFRRAANLIAQHEDALIFQGRSTKSNPSTAHNIGLADVSYGIPANAPIEITGQEPVEGIFPDARSKAFTTKLINPTSGVDIVSDIIKAINALETRTRVGPFACVLGHGLFEAICTPSASMVLPRDRILPFLQGPLVRCSTVPPTYGAVIALSGSPIEIVVARELGVRFLQTNLEPRLVFQVSERVALRIEDAEAIQTLI